MKTIHEKDMYPFYEIEDDVVNDRRITAELIKRYEDCMEEFDAIQKILADLYQSS